MLLDEAPSKLFRYFLTKCKLHGIDPDLVRRVAVQTVAHLRNPKRARKKSAPLQHLEQQWYESLSGDDPDWSVYAADAYMGELWACWAVYSRPYLRAIRRRNSMRDCSIVEALAPVRKVVDLGCGFGFTTAALRQMFPDAEVVGTNLEGTKQAAVARDIGTLFGFCVVPDIGSSNPADLVFASEYFEHFREPTRHLESVLDATRARALLVANAFTARSIGHFESYLVGGELVGGRVAARGFDHALRRRGYAKLKTRLWNNRPAYWRQG